MSKTILAGALMASVLLALPLAAGADSGHGDEGHGPSKGDHEGHEDATPAYASLADAWTALTGARDAIAADVESGALGDVHARAEPLPELVAALLEQSGDLDAGRRSRVEGAAKQVPRLADALHDAADGGDAARTRKQLSRLDGLLELIRAQYPAGALDPAALDHEDHSAAPGNARGVHAHMDRPTGVVDATPQATVRIQAFDRLHFEPTRIEVQAGVPTRIELANVGAADHTLVVKTPDGEQDWVHLHVPPGVTEAVTYQLDESGTYRVLCTVLGHTEGGMVWVAADRSAEGEACAAAAARPLMGFTMLSPLMGPYEELSARHQAGCASTARNLRTERDAPCFTASMDFPKRSAMLA